MGHTSCGAVTGALNYLKRNGGQIDRPSRDHLNAVLIPIETAIIEAGIDIYAQDALEKAGHANLDRGDAMQPMSSSTSRGLEKR